MLHLCKNRTETMAGQAAIRCISSFLRQVGRNPFHERCDSGVDTRIRILGTADSPADDTHLRPFTVSRFLVNQRTTAVALYTGYIQINCKYSLHTYDEACYLTRVFAWISGTNHGVNDTTWCVASISSLTLAVVLHLDRHLLQTGRLTSTCIQRRILGWGNQS